MLIGYSSFGCRTRSLRHGDVEFERYQFANWSRGHGAPLPPAQLVRVPCGGRTAKPVRAPPIDHPLVLQHFVALPPSGSRRCAKAYPPGSPTIPLPRQWPPVGASATAVLSGRHVASPTTVDLPGSQGCCTSPRASCASVQCVRRTHVHGRSAPPALRGAWFPLEVYVAARGVAGLGDGVYRYNPVDHALLPSRHRARRGHNARRHGHPVADRWNMRSAFRHITGMVVDAAQALVVAESAGFAPRLWTRFPDLEGRIAGRRGRRPGVSARPRDPRRGRTVDPAGGGAAVGSRGDDPDEFPLITLAQHAGDLDQARIRGLPAIPLRIASRVR